MLQVVVTAVHPQWSLPLNPVFRLQHWGIEKMGQS